MTRVRLALLALLSVGLSTPVAAQSLPAQLTDAEFWQLVTDFSEPSGSFGSENFLSNESEYQTVIPELMRTIKPGGVYLGVGPEQNFTYIAAVRPGLAFIIDIRRQAVLQHLVYKAVFELADNRADFLAFLFARSRPPGLDQHATPDALFAAYEKVAADSLMSLRNAARIIDWLAHHHGFALSTQDLDDIRHVYKIISREGPYLFYASSESGPRVRRVSEAAAWAPTRSIGADYTSYMVATDKGMITTDSGGVQRSYLATEANFRVVRDLQRRNLVVPVVGDFAGPSAIRSVGQFLKQRHATVTVFYISNVEFYLFKQEGAWQRFYANVGLLPLGPQSTFIRARPVSELGSIRDLLTAIAAGRVTTYANLRDFSHR